MSIVHPDGFRIIRALIEDLQVSPDFRELDNIRFGFAPLYTSFVDVWRSVARVIRVMKEKKYVDLSKKREGVT